MQVWQVRLARGLEEVSPERDTDVFSTLARVELREPHAKIVGSANVRVKVHFRK